MWGKRLSVAIFLLFGARFEFARADQYGPSICTTCAAQGNLGSPLPGPDARQFLDRYIDALAAAGTPIRPTDQIMVCNRVQCVNYTKTQNSWMGGSAVPRTAGSGAGGDPTGGIGSNPTNGGVGGGTGGGGSTRTLCGNVNGVRSTCIVG